MPLQLLKYRNVSVPVRKQLSVTLQSIPSLPVAPHPHPGNPRLPWPSSWRVRPHQSRGLAHCAEACGCAGVGNADYQLWDHTHLWTDKSSSTCFQWFEGLSWVDNKRDYIHWLSPKGRNRINSYKLQEEIWTEPKEEWIVRPVQRKIRLLEV